MYLLPEQTITPNTIHHMEASRFINCLPDDSVDLVVTSPPYDNLRTYNGYSFPFEDIARGLYRVLKSGGVLVWIVGDATENGSETLTSFRQALYFKDVCGFNVHDTMIYNKNSKNPNIHHPRYMQQFEYMFVLTKSKPKTFNPLEEINKNFGKSISHSRKTQTNGSKKAWGQATVYNNTSKRGNIWTYNTGSSTGDDKLCFEHPAPFPELLARDHVYTWSNVGDLVFDPFMGSGTTAKMAKALNRDYIGCDISREYVELARDRVRNSDPFQASRHKKTGYKQLSLFG